MQYEWDSVKDARNRAVHGIAFEDAIAIFAGRTLESEDVRKDYGEDRLVVSGLLDGRVIVVVYTARGDRRRIISARLANRKERERYAEGE
ncbi:MAG: BrnT family toxin [Gemmatimonadales bacterium]